MNILAKKIYAFIAFILVLALFSGCAMLAGKTTIESSSEKSTSKPDSEAKVVYSEEVTTPLNSNTRDFSGDWAGTMLIAEVIGDDAEEFKDLENVIFDCVLRLSLSADNTGTGVLMIEDENHPELGAAAEYDRLALYGELWGDPFEWEGTFEYINDEDLWTLVGSGNIYDRTADVIFHTVLRLSLFESDIPAESTTEKTDISETAEVVENTETIDTNAPLEEFLLGVWMGPESNVMVERLVLEFYEDGKIDYYYAKPDSDDTIETWKTGNWKIDQINTGVWETDGNKLSAVFDNDLISFETDVRVIDASTIGIEIFYTKSEYTRLS